jgi:CRISPR type I-E-associated protein CasB/Cse2
MSEAPPTLDGLLAEIRQAAAPGHPDRGKLAALRHGFGETTASLAWPYIAPYCDLTDARQRTLWLTVAATAATLQPDGLVRRGAGNVGATMRNLALGKDAHAKDAEKTLASFEARFRRLLSGQTSVELCQHLTTVVRAASAKGVALDVRQLFEDLQDWERRDVRDVPVEWARGYWVAPLARKEEPACAT